MAVVIMLLLNTRQAGITFKLLIHYNGFQQPARSVFHSIFPSLFLHASSQGFWDGEAQLHYISHSLDTKLKRNW